MDLNRSALPWKGFCPLRVPPLSPPSLLWGRSASPSPQLLTAVWLYQKTACAAPPGGPPAPGRLRTPPSPLPSTRQKEISFRSFKAEKNWQHFSDSKATDFQKDVLDSRPEILQHSFTKVLQVFQIWTPVHNAPPFTGVAVRRNKNSRKNSHKSSNSLLVWPFSEEFIFFNTPTSDIVKTNTWGHGF